jgi:hypothetical protein
MIAETSKLHTQRHTPQCASIASYCFVSSSLITWTFMMDAIRPPPPRNINSNKFHTAQLPTRLYFSYFHFKGSINLKTLRSTHKLRTPRLMSSCVEIYVMLQSPRLLTLEQKQ